MHDDTDLLTYCLLPIYSDIMHSKVEALAIYSPSSLVISYPSSATPLQNINHWLFP